MLLSMLRGINGYNSSKLRVISLEIGGCIVRNNGNRVVNARGLNLESATFAKSWWIAGIEWTVGGLATSASIAVLSKLKM